MTISRRLDVRDIHEILSCVENYSFIKLSLDITEVDIKGNRENFDKIIGFRNHDKIKIEVCVPPCQLSHDQRLLSRVYNNIIEPDCFPGWDHIIVDNDMNIKNCIASDVKMKFDDSISFLEYKNILYEDTRKELDELPLKRCNDCFSFRSGICFGGCKFWKDHVKINHAIVH